MIYKCKWCKREIKELETDGEGVCNDLVCQKCAKREVDGLARKNLRSPNHYSNKNNEEEKL